MEVADRIAELLRQAEAPLVPLAQLSGRLESDRDHPPGDAGLRSLLASRPDRFVVLERPVLFAGAEHWPEEERRAYAQALRAAGFETQALVGEAAAAARDEGAEPPGQESPLGRVATSLAQIADCAPPDGLLRERLWECLPLADATMRALAQAWRARRALEAPATASPQPSG